MHYNNQPHSFHIPVMGLAYTIDSPIKVAKYGISSVISIVDDFLIEKMNEFYSKKYELPHTTISIKDIDYRAKRITSYLNTVDTIVKLKFEKLKNSFNEQQSELEKYIDLLPDMSTLKQEFSKLITSRMNGHEIRKWIEQHLHPGSIDVNIMTKVDKANYNKKEKLPLQFNDAHAALRGFANSDLASSLILSAGMNPRLYSYLEDFKDFYPDSNGILKKKIILKVSDFRSAVIQGKFLAKKGIWVSEFRIESGLNCGGHAFASDGHLLGPILEEFKEGKTALVSELHEIFTKALAQKNRFIPDQELNLKITVQGGVGTAEEHNFLLENYEVDGVGWGTPFLLVPEASTVDQPTLNLLKDAKEEDLYLSNVSPLGVPFNNVKGNSNELLRDERIEKNKPGSACPKKFLALNTEFSDRAICTASKKYQRKKIDLVENVDNETQGINSKDHITDKSCLCEGLANAALTEYDIQKKGEDQGVVVCPGPNMAYFTDELSLKEMVQHIYGKRDVIKSKFRPNMFVKELYLYIDYFKNQLLELKTDSSIKQIKRLEATKKNLLSGIAYYTSLFSKRGNQDEGILDALFKSKSDLAAIQLPQSVV